MKIDYINSENKSTFIDFLKENNFSTVEHYMVMERIEMNYSFLIYFNNKPSLLFPFVVENSNNSLRASFQGVSLPSPLFSNEIINSNKILIKIIKNALGIINNICIEKNIESIKFNFLTKDIDIKGYQVLHTLLKREFYQLDIFDIGFLNLKDEKIYSNFSKGLKYDIKKWKDILKVNFFKNDKVLLSYEQFSQKLEHYKNNDLKVLYTLYSQNMVDFITVEYESSVCGYLFFLVNSSNKIVTYYSAFKIDKLHAPIHAVGLYYALLRYQEEGYNQLELGILSSSINIEYIPSQKQQNISSFKSSFGPKLKHMSVYKRFFHENGYQEHMLKRLQMMGKSI